MAKVEHCKIYTIVAKYRRERDGNSDTIIQHLPTVSHAAPLAVWTPARLGSIRFDSIHLLLSCEARGKREDPSAGPPLRSPGVCEEPNPSASSASRKEGRTSHGPGFVFVESPTSSPSSASSPSSSKQESSDSAAIMLATAWLLSSSQEDSPLPRPGR